MVAKQKPNGHTAHAQRQWPSNLGLAYSPNPYDDAQVREAVMEGVKAVVRCVDSGTLSEEKGYALIRAMFAGYYVDPLSQRVADHLEAALSSLLEQEAEGTGVGGKR